MRKNYLLLLGIVFMTISGCETVKGIARDIENTGENMGQAVDHVMSGGNTK